MQYLSKSLLIIFFFILLSGIAFSDSNGLVSDWQPFVINDFHEVNHSKKNLLNNPVFYRGILKNCDNNEFLPDNLQLIKNFPGAQAGKSVLSRIKVSFSTISSFMLPYEDLQSRGYESKLSQAVSALPSLLQNFSHDMTIETLKLIEPQVNLGFEF